MAIQMRKRLRLAIAVLAAGALVAACGGAAEEDLPPAADSVIDGVDVSGVTLKFADQGSHYKSFLTFGQQADSTPYKVEFSNFAGNQEALEVLHAGAVDIATAGQTGLINAFSNGSPGFQVIAKNAMGDDKVSGFAIMVPEGSSVEDVTDLRGKSIAVDMLGNPRYALIKILESAGMTEDDVEMKPLNQADSFAAFAAGQVDAWVSNEPNTSLARTQLGAKVIATGLGVVKIQSFLSASNAALKDPAKRAALGDLIRRFMLAQKYASENLDEWAKVYQKNTQLPMEAVELAFKNMPHDFGAVTKEELASVQEQSDRFFEIGLIKNGPEVAQYFDLEFPSQAAK